MDIITVDYEQPPESERFDVTKGTFVAMERFPLDVRERPMRYGVVCELTADAFYAELGRDVPKGPVATSTISDALVRLFDCSQRRDGKRRPALYAFRAADGRLVTQHST